MHELALAEAVVTTALAVAEREGIREITRVDVRIGELQRIEREVFEFALQEVMPAAEPRIASAKITLQIEPARLHCQPCGHEFGLADTRGPAGETQAEAIHFVPELARAFLECPQCGSPDFEITEGRGVSIESLEGD